MSLAPLVLQPSPNLTHYMCTQHTHTQQALVRARVPISLHEATTIVRAVGADLVGVVCEQFLRVVQAHSLNNLKGSRGDHMAGNAGHEAPSAAGSYLPESAGGGHSYMHGDAGSPGAPSPGPYLHHVGGGDGSQLPGHGEGYGGVGAGRGGAAAASAPPPQWYQAHANGIDRMSQAPVYPGYGPGGLGPMNGPSTMRTSASGDSRWGVTKKYKSQKANIILANLWSHVARWQC
jgi:hypothetical protein